MTTTEIVRLLHAKSAGNNKWQGHCPVTRNHSHNDRNPSLSIGAGNKPGFTVLKCQAGCDVHDIVASLGWRMRDLCGDGRPDRKAIELAEKARTAEAYRCKAVKCKWRAALGQAIYWRDRRDELGKMLYEQPSSDKMASLFHAACRRSANASEECVQCFCKLSPKFHPDNLLRVDSLGTGELLPEPTLAVLIFWSSYEIWDGAKWLAKRESERKSGRGWPVYPWMKAKMDPDTVMRRSVEIASQVEEYE
jgi:hypothetical protein